MVKIASARQYYIICMPEIAASVVTLGKNSKIKQNKKCYTLLFSERFNTNYKTKD